MIYKNPFKNLSKFEWGLWSFSIIFTVISYIIGNSGGVLSLIASLIGATALIFVSKGDVFGQFLIVIFALLYGYISLSFKSKNKKGQDFLSVCEAISNRLTATEEWKALPDYENLYE